MSALIEACGVSRDFDGVRVLYGIDLALRGGEVTAIVGENGAGKSTLMRILGGVLAPSEGTLRIGGAEARLASPLEARRRGVVLIHQEPLSFPHLSVAENIRLGASDEGLFRRVRWGAMRADARRVLDDLGVGLDVDRPMAGLSIADQQMVEIACALAADGRVIIMDEPTAALTPAETDRLLQVADRLRREGRAVVFISHRLAEVRRISDRIVVLRDGRLVADRPAAEFASEADIVSAMIGRDLAPAEASAAAPGDVVLAVEGLTAPGRFEDVSFEVRAGEVVGLAGLVGAGRTEVAEALFGVAPARAGSVRLDGAAVNVRSPAQAMRLGIAMIPEDRARDALFGDLSVAQNVTAARPGQATAGGLLSGRRERDLAQAEAERLQIRLADVGQPIRTLSGGNQQKAVLARWLLEDPRLLILDEPTRGVDVGMKAEIHRLVRELAARGKAVLVISSDMAELLALGDRIVVMSAGRVTAELARAEASEEAVMQAAVARAGAAA